MSKQTDQTNSAAGQNKPAAPITEPQPAGVQTQSAVVAKNPNKVQWVVNPSPVMATVKLVRLSDNQAVEMFVMPQGRAAIPPGHAYDRSTQVKHPQTRVVAR